MKLFLNLLCVLIFASTAFAAEEWLNFSSPFPVKAAVPYGDGLIMATGGGVRYRTNTADDLYTTANGLGDQSVSGIAISDLGVFAVTDYGIIASIGPNGHWQILSRSYAGSNVRVIPGLVRLSKSVLVIAFEDRLSFFGLNNLSSIITIDKISNLNLAMKPITAMEIHGDSLFVAADTSLFVRKMNWEKLDSDWQLNNPESWSVVKGVSNAAGIKAIAWKDGKLKTYTTEGTRMWDKDGATIVAADTFSVFSSSSSMVFLRGKALMDSVLYELDSIPAKTSKDGMTHKYYRSKVQWVTLLSSNKAVLAGPNNVFYYDGKKISDLSPYNSFALGGAYELETMANGGVIAASEDGKFSYNYGFEWSTPKRAYESFGNLTNARGHDLKVLTALPTGALFYHIWGYGFFWYSDWGDTLRRSALAGSPDLCMDNFLEEMPDAPPYTIAVSTTAAPDKMGFFTTSASNKGYSLIYFDADGYISCASNIGSAPIAGPMLVHEDKNTGNWVAYVGTRAGASTSAEGGLDVITFPPPGKTGGALSDKISKDNVKTYYGTSTTPLDLVYEPKSGYFWMVTESSLEYWNSEQDELKNPLSTNGLIGAGFTSIDADSRGNLWVGTSTQGAFRLTPRTTSPDTLSVVHFTTRQGLLSDRVQDVAVDSILGFVWFAHESGISRYRRNDLRGADGNMTNDARKEVKVFPNPFRPRLQPYVVFDNLSNDAVIGVYNRGGKLVVSLSGNDIAGGRAEWNGRMKDGNLVAPGVYQYVIRGGSMVKKGKLLIIH